MHQEAEDRVTKIARIAHEMNRQWCQLTGDYSQLLWENAPGWQRASAIKGVEYHLANPNSTPADSHNSWLLEKMKDGWVFGEVKDPEKKQHPCMVPYEALPAVQRAKDAIFLAVVRGLAEQ